MARAREYIPVRYDRGTSEAVEELADYIGATSFKTPREPAEVSRSDIMREVMSFGLEVYKRRADAWRAEQQRAATKS